MFLYRKVFSITITAENLYGIIRHLYTHFTRIVFCHSSFWSWVVCVLFRSQACRISNSAAAISVAMSASLKETPWNWQWADWTGSAPANILLPLHRAPLGNTLNANEAMGNSSPSSTFHGLFKPSPTSPGLVSASGSYQIPFPQFHWPACPAYFLFTATETFCSFFNNKGGRIILVLGSPVRHIHYSHITVLPRWSSFFCSIDHPFISLFHCCISCCQHRCRCWLQLPVNPFRHQSILAVAVWEAIFFFLFFITKTGIWPVHRELCRQAEAYWAAHFWYFFTLLVFKIRKTGAAILSGTSTPIIPSLPISLNTWTGNSGFRPTPSPHKVWYAAVQSPWLIVQSVALFQSLKVHRKACLVVVNNRATFRNGIVAQPLGSRDGKQSYCNHYRRRNLD